MGSLPGVRRAIAIFAAATAGIGALAGCGEKDEPETTGPVVTAQTSTPATTGTTSANETTTTTTAKAPVGTSPAEAAMAFLSSPDAEAVCDEVLTPAFLRTAYGDRSGCIAARRPASLADPNSKLEVGPPSNAGTRVDAEPSGGLYDGEKLKITIVEQGEAYLIDAVESNVPVGP